MTHLSGNIMNCGREKKIKLKSLDLSNVKLPELQHNHRILKVVIA
jgi:hypothetical protein